MGNEIIEESPLLRGLPVHDQAELDKALAEGIADLRIEHPLGIYLNIADDPGFRLTLWGNSRAKLRENSRAELRENASAELWENASAKLWGNSSAELWENASAELWGNASAELWENSRAELRENASASLLENASATLLENASAELSRFTVAWLRSPSAKATGTGHVIDVTDAVLSTPDAWAEYHGVEVINGIATVYKALYDHYGTNRPEWRGAYAPGKAPEAPDWRDDAFCGGGLHFSPTPRQASDYLWGATRWVKVGVELATLRPILDGGTPKCKVPKVVVPCVEVDINGDPVEPVIGE